MDKYSTPYGANNNNFALAIIGQLLLALYFSFKIPSVSKHGLMVRAGYYWTPSFATTACVIGATLFWICFILCAFVFIKSSYEQTMLTIDDEKITWPKRIVRIKYIDLKLKDIMKVRMKVISRNKAIELTTDGGQYTILKNLLDDDDIFEEIYSILRQKSAEQVDDGKSRTVIEGSAKLKKTLSPEPDAVALDKEKKGYFPWDSVEKMDVPSDGEKEKNQYRTEAKEFLKEASVARSIIQNCLFFIFAVTVIMICVYSIKTTYHIWSNFKYIKDPHIADVYLISSGRLKNTEFGTGQSCSTVKGAYMIYIVTDIDSKNVTLVGNSSEYGPLDYAIKNADNFVKKKFSDYEPGYKLLLPKDRLHSLNLFRVITYIKRYEKIDIDNLINYAGLEHREPAK